MRMARPEDLREGYYVRVLTPALEGRFFRVGKSEPFTYETGTSDVAEFTEVESGSESGFKNIDVLEPDDSPRHLFWVEWGVKDGAKYYIKIPTGTDRLGTDEDKDVGFVTNEKSPYYAPDPRYGFWLVHDYYPAVNAVNVTPFSLTPKVWFEGVKWDLEDVVEPDVLEKLRNFQRGVSPGIPFTEITIGGIKYAE
jgi:hypothetical protein